MQYRAVYRILAATLGALAAGTAGYVAGADAGKQSTLGELTFTLGDDYDSVVKSFEGKFRVRGLEPDWDRPEYKFYAVETPEGVVSDKLGSLTFKNDRLFSVSRRVSEYAKDDAGKLIADIVDRLADVNTGTDKPLRVWWDNGEVDGRKEGNTTLEFIDGERRLSVHFFDCQNGSQTVSISERVGGQ